MGALTFWHGDWLAALFARDSAVVAAARQYLQAYAIDCLLTPLLFCFTGYFNGCEKTLFVMAQGIIGAFCVRIPVAWAMSRLPETSLFLIGLGTPASSLVQDHLRRRQGLTGKTILIRKVCCRGFPVVMLKCTKPAKLRGM